MKKHTGKKWNRRQFIRNTALAAGGLMVGPNIISSTAWGQETKAAASERITVGVIGVGGRGRGVMNAFMDLPDVHVVAVCDTYGDRRQAGVDQVNQRYGNQDCANYIDMNELLARQDIDAVLIATGDNWHSGASITAARAGKDIYCEKPMSVAIPESRAVSDTMLRLGRIFQCGTQRRSIGNFIFACDLARSGKLGELKEVHAEEAGGMLTFNDEILPEEPLPPREVFDWDRWLGPAQWRPYNSKYATRGFWSNHVDFSGASITEWGSHTVDLCQWANSADDTSPIEYWAEDGRHYGRYANGVKLVIRLNIGEPKMNLGSCPVRFVGTEGWVETGDSGQINAEPLSLLGNRGFPGGYPPDNHVRAFIDSVKTRQECISTAETAHRSISACHVANICKRLGRPIKWDPVKEECIDDVEANRLTNRAYREPWYL